MINFLQNKQSSFIYKIFCGFIALTFSSSVILPPAPVFAQTVLNLPVPGTMVPPSAGFMPALMTGVTIHPDNPLRFDFIMDHGQSGLTGEPLKAEYQKMIKYFMASLTVPEEELWVNLSPYEKDRMIAEGLGQTEMGRDMLAQDYLLKQLTASLMYPEEELGKEFWNKVYQKAREKFGTTEIPVNTFNKVWIIPDEALVYEQGSSAFVIKSHLAVMLEQDYEAMSHKDTKSQGHNDTGDVVTTGIIHEVIIPAIEKEVNEGKNFANLRQMYHSLILAAWYKLRLKDGLLGKIYVDQNKTKGIDTEDKTVNQKIFDQYLESFKKGVYNYIKEDVDPATDEIVPRKYFSGGMAWKLGGLKTVGALAIGTLLSFGSPDVGDASALAAAAMGGNKDGVTTEFVDNAGPGDVGTAITVNEGTVHPILLAQMSSSPVESFWNDGPPQRLTILQVKKIFLSGLKDLTGRFKELQTIIRESVTSFETEGTDVFSTRWLPLIQTKSAEINRLVDDLQNVSLLVGFVEDDIKGPLDEFLGQLSEEFKADKVLLYRLWAPAYSLGFSGKELSAFYDNFFAIGNMLREQKKKDGRDNLIIQEGERALSLTQVTSLVGLDLDRNTEIYLGRTLKTVDQIGKFSEEDEKVIQARLNDLLESGKAVWPAVRERMKELGYVHFDFFMRGLKHNTGINFWNVHCRPVFNKLKEDVAKAGDGSLVLYDLKHFLDRLIFSISSNESYIELLEKGDHFQAADVVPLIKERVELYRAEIEKKGLILEFASDQQQLIAESVDPNYLRLIVDNLLQNAIKYTDHGKIVARLYQGDYPSESWREKIENAVVLVVEDTGIGIPVEEQINIAQRGGRASNVGERPGSGLGLDFVRHAVFAMEGQFLTFSGGTGKGAKFIAVLHPASSPVGKKTVDIGKAQAMLRNMPDDYYERLGVGKTGDFDTIRKAYRNLVRSWHPDNYPQASKELHELGTKITQKFNEAWEILKNEEKRRQYDSSGPYHSAGFSPGTADDDSEFYGVGAADFRFMSLEEILNELNNEDTWARVEAIDALHNIDLSRISAGNVRDVSALVKAIKHNDDWFTRYHGIGELGRIARDKTYVYSRMGVAAGAGRTPKSIATQAIIELLETDPHQHVRGMCIIELFQIADADSIRALIKNITQNESFIRDTIEVNIIALANDEKTGEITVTLLDEALANSDRDSLFYRLLKDIRGKIKPVFVKTQIDVNLRMETLKRMLTDLSLSEKGESFVADNNWILNIPETVIILARDGNEDYLNEALALRQDLIEESPAFMVVSAEQVSSDGLPSAIGVYHGGGYSREWQDKQKEIIRQWLNTKIEQTKAMRSSGPAEQVQGEDAAFASSPVEEAVSRLIKTLKPLNGQLQQELAQLDTEFFPMRLNRLDVLVNQITSALRNFRPHGGKDKMVITVIQDVLGNQTQGIISGLGWLEKKMERDDLSSFREDFEDYLEQFRRLELIVELGELRNIEHYHTFGHFMNLDQLPPMKALADKLGLDVDAIRRAKLSSHANVFPGLGEIEYFIRLLKDQSDRDPSEVSNAVLSSDVYPKGGVALTDVFFSDVLNRLEISINRQEAIDILKAAVTYAKSESRVNEYKLRVLPKLRRLKGVLQARFDAELINEAQSSSPVGVSRAQGIPYRGLPSVAGDRVQGTEIANTVPGGIDLNPALLDLQIKRDGNGVPLPLPQQPVETMHIEGFLPVILNIVPINNLPLLLGLADTSSAPEEIKPALKTREIESVGLLN